MKTKAPLLAGEIDLRIDAPQRIRLNDGVTLTCSMDYTHSKLIKPRDTCTLWWTKPGENPPWKVGLHSRKRDPVDSSTKSCPSQFGANVSPKS